MHMVNTKLNSFWVTENKLVSEHFKDMRVLVTGADGFLGVNTIHALQQLGAIVSIISRRKRPRAGGELHRVFHGDIGDTSLLREAVKNQDIIFNFAGVSSSVESNRSPEDSLDAECRIHMRLIHECSKTMTQPLIIFSSTRLVYGKPDYLPVDESHPLLPMSMYAVNKITVENYLRLFSQIGKLDYMIFRISNPYGPHQRIESSGYGIINRFIQYAAEGREISIFGKGDQKRDYIYINDTVSAILTATATRKCLNQIFNLGGSSGISLSEAAATIASQVKGVTINNVPWPDDYRQVETGDYISDVSKLRELIQLPKFTTFSDGVRMTLQHYRSISDVSDSATIKNTA